jgi:diaminohydroxyphosphoribosylaminopyrimidine deaminase/5-amino-6-(5-phosphoribosylamino)uracil reductase
MSGFTDLDRTAMARALAVALGGLFTATPNPRVGCVVVRDGAVLGEGFHARTGEAHAEVLAIAAARAGGRDPRGSTMYVTLEPCNHHGRTPPCVDAIIAAGIARVVVAMADPNADAAHGAQRLRAAGVDVAVGLMERVARELNAGFVSRMTRGVPWVRVKIATSLDGRTALVNGASQWITGEAARADGHYWRARACAVLTGAGTIVADDPALTVRAVPTSRPPLRVVIDPRGQTPPGARVFADDAPTVIVTAGPRDARWPARVESISIPGPEGRVDLPALLRELARRGVNELHVEAGARLNGALLAAGFVDEVVQYVAPCVLGDPARGMFEMPAALTSLDTRVRLACHAVDRVGGDLRIIARVQRP